MGAAATDASGTAPNCTSPWDSAGSRRPGGRDFLALGNVPAVVGVSVVALGVHAGGVDTAGTPDHRWSYDRG